MTMSAVSREMRQQALGQIPYNTEVPVTGQDSSPKMLANVTTMMVCIMMITVTVTMGCDVIA